MSTRLWVLVVAVACTDAEPTPNSVDSPCATPEGLGRPGTIEQAIELIDALPRPVTVPCLLESFERPMGLEAVNSLFSAQPAVGQESPRFFVMSGDLAISFVPAGTGRPLVEFGERIDDTDTVKGELHFPVEGDLALADAYDRISGPDGTATGCGLCHLDERPWDGAEGAFVSNGLAPAVSGRVSIDAIIAVRHACDPVSEPDRCAVLAALVDHGELVHQPFPDAFASLDDR